MTQSSPHDLSNRYARQIAFDPIGAQGQQSLAQRDVALIGCGALGASIAEMLVRAGLGRLRVIDRDFLELSNLQRQMLFDENDVAAHLPKARAAANKLARINSDVRVDAMVASVNCYNIAMLTANCDLILDGTDNLLTRFLINDYCVRDHRPWIYGGCIASEGRVMTIRPGGRPCLRCIFEQPPRPGQMETCTTLGIISPAVNMTAALVVAEALKILTGTESACRRELVRFDLWRNTFERTNIADLDEGCACCGERRFDYLEGEGAFDAVVLCGQDAVQIQPQDPHTQIDLAALAARLAGLGPIVQNEFLLKLQWEDKEITIFPDARAIIQGVTNEEEAQAVYARIVGQ